MTVNASRSTTTLDAGETVEMRAPGLGAETANGYNGEAAVPFQRGAARWNDGKPLESGLLISGLIFEIAPSGTYTIEVASAPTKGGTRTTLAAVEVSSVGPWSVSFASEKVPPSDEWLAVGVRIAGGGLIDYSATLRRLPGA